MEENETQDISCKSGCSVVPKEQQYGNGKIKIEHLASAINSVVNERSNMTITGAS